ncbi:unnamed protein product [Meganyctiphanes norvegica]|uniref:Reelin domain-containing protein n=1 Tax=Meganyctiphanes norvegica TaxID=48144 RepID=A0AAV2R5F5_MEGNR
MGFSQAIVLVSVCIIVLPACYAFSGLDVTLACNTMTPGHLAFGGAQRSTAPYQITTKNNNDGTLDVIVNGDEFKGFLLQARNAGGKRVGSSPQQQRIQEQLTVTIRGVLSNITTETTSGKSS